MLREINKEFIFELNSFYHTNQCVKNKRYKVKELSESFQFFRLLIASDPKISLATFIWKDSTLDCYYRVINVNEQVVQGKQERFLVIIILPAICQVYRALTKDTNVWQMFNKYIIITSFSQMSVAFMADLYEGDKIQVEDKRALI